MRRRRDPVRHYSIEGARLNGARTEEMLNRSPMLHQKQHGPASRSQRGQRLLAAVPHAHWKTSTFVAGLRVTGLTAPLIVYGAMNGVTFLARAEQCLAPTPGTRRYRHHG
jgi:hypothetical protein